LHLPSNATAPSDLYTLSLHDALPISVDHPHVADHDRHDQDRQRVVEVRRICRLAERGVERIVGDGGEGEAREDDRLAADPVRERSEEHTSELQSPYDLVCRLLLEKKK